jgi:thioredoxin reductase
VIKLTRNGSYFEAVLADGRIIQSSAVIMAPGLANYLYYPPEYTRLPPELVSHTSKHVLFDQFAGKKVAVIGGEQGALETAALVHEAGAEVSVVSRSPLRWLQGDSLENRTILRRIQYPKAGISPGWFNWGLEHLPYAFQKHPRNTKDALLQGRRSYGPACAAWLKPRILGKVTLHEGQHVREIHDVDDGVALLLMDDTRLKVDLVFLGTGYRVDSRQLSMRDPSLLAQVQMYEHAPILNQRFESSVPGLYFIGISSVSSCGPLYRFVVGTEATAKRVTAAVTQRLALVR